jgi:hypothetical protein
VDAERVWPALELNGFALALELEAGRAAGRDRDWRYPKNFDHQLKYPVALAAALTGIVASLVERVECSWRTVVGEFKSTQRSPIGYQTKLLDCGRMRPRKRRAGRC